MVSLGGAWHSQEDGEETLLTNPKSRPDRRETELGVWSCHREEESEETMATRLKIWAQSRPSSVSRRSRLDFGWVNRVSSSSFPECHAPPNDTVLRWPVSSESLFSPPNNGYSGPGAPGTAVAVTPSHSCTTSHPIRVILGHPASHTGRQSHPGHPACTLNQSLTGWDRRPGSCTPDISQLTVSPWDWSAWSPVFALLLAPP